MPKKKDETKGSEIRKTLIVDESVSNKIDAIAYWDRLTIKEVVHAALTQYITSYERKNGEIKLPGK